jgi:hypothetical protein
LFVGGNFPGKWKKYGGAALQIVTCEVGVRVCFLFILKISVVAIFLSETGSSQFQLQGSTPEVKLQVTNAGTVFGAYSWLTPL